MQQDHNDDATDAALEAAARSLEAGDPELALTEVSRSNQVGPRALLEVRAYLDLGMLDAARGRLEAAQADLDAAQASHSLELQALRGAHAAEAHDTEEDACLCLWAGCGHRSAGARFHSGHEAVHTGVYPFTCPACGAGFNSASNAKMCCVAVAACRPDVEQRIAPAV